MKPGSSWARSFTVDHEDLDYLINLLLERETPLTTEQLALALIEERLNQEKAALEEQYKDTHLYNPAHSYEVGQKLIFPALNYTMGVVVEKRPGINPEHEPFTVIGVEFEDDPPSRRSFAADLSTPHILSQDDSNGFNPLLAPASESTPEEILKTDYEDIIDKVEELLVDSESLVRLAQRWFPRELILDVNVGHLNLAEAVLDLSGGGPLTTREILKQMGGLGSSPNALQVFSLDYTFNQDPRFDEVGPAGEVLWYLTRLEPPEVLKMPTLLDYEPIEYDRSVLTPAMLDLEAEIGDELSPLVTDKPVEQAEIILSYPHRRVGTLPLNHKLRHIFPTARRTERIWVTLVDGQDDEEFPGWVVRDRHYVFGLSTFFRKHHLPVGAFVAVRKGDHPGTFVVDYTAHRPRTEWIRLIVPQNGKLSFENEKRSIGAAYDELMILGVDDLQALDDIYHAMIREKRSLVYILKSLIPVLGRLTPQGTVHAKTLYSAVNVLRRCPPGPIFATLLANPDFEDVGGHYWKLSD